MEEDPPRRVAGSGFIFSLKTISRISFFPIDLKIVYHFVMMALFPFVG